MVVVVCIVVENVVVVVVVRFLAEVGVDLRLSSASQHYRVLTCLCWGFVLTLL